MEKKSLMESLLLEAQSIDKTTSKESCTFRVLMEQERFRQDCRKRSLDLAAGEYAEWYRSRNHPKSPTPTGEDLPPNIIELAKNYYNWLVTLPD
jgi:hypothetical protein